MLIEERKYALELINFGGKIFFHDILKVLHKMSRNRIGPEGSIYYTISACAIVVPHLRHILCKYTKINSRVPT
jgi:hypothetical protein